MDLQVTKAHIDRARKFGGEGVCNKCPIALALLDEGYIKAVVGEDIITFQANANWSSNPQVEAKWEKLNYKTPKHISHWIHDFDNGKKVDPIIVNLSSPVSIIPAQ